VWIREKEEVFEFPAETRPLMVRFDEGNVLLKEVTFARDQDALAYQLAHDDVIGRMEAAGELARAKEIRAAFDSLAASAAGDPFWAVRRSAVEALARLADERAPAVLKKTCLDAHSSVRAASLSALGDRKDRSLAAFFIERMSSDGSELAKVEAVRALGKAGDPSVVPLLEKLASVPSFRDLVKNAAAQALKALGKQ
jgi:aminopeptidase N